MAKNTMTRDEKTVLIVIFAGALLVGVWAGYAAICGFTGWVTLAPAVSTILASISGLMVSLMVAMVVVIRKA